MMPTVVLLVVMMVIWATMYWLTLTVKTYMEAGRACPVPLVGAADYLYGGCIAITGPGRSGGRCDRGRWCDARAPGSSVSAHVRGFYRIREGGEVIAG